MARVVQRPLYQTEGHLLQQQVLPRILLVGALQDRPPAIDDGCRPMVCAAVVGASLRGHKNDPGYDRQWDLGGGQDTQTLAVVMRS